MSIDTGGRFLLKDTGSTAAITAGNLVLNGGITDFAVANSDSLSVTLAGSINVLRASAIGSSRHTIATPGLQTLKGWMIDPGVVMDKLTLAVNSGL